jgi:capsular polysaccharide biosynthesis protein
LLKGAVLGVFAAFGLGIGIPFVLELLHRRVRCRDDIERSYGIPVLAEFSRLPVRSRA